jgi:two-component system sensor histidine kinase KdpD
MSLFSGSSYTRSNLVGNTPMLSCTELALSVLACAGAGMVAWALEQWIGLQDLSLIFMVAVIVVASRTRMSAAVATALLCFLTYTFFFIEPRWAFQISARQSVVTVTLFLIAALLAGRLASALRTKLIALQTANAHAVALHGLGRDLANAADISEVMRAGCTAISTQFHASVWLQINGVTNSSAPVIFGDIDRRALDWTLSHGEACGRFTNVFPRSRWWFLPVHNESKTIGVTGIDLSASHSKLSIEKARLAEAMVDDIGQAALRARLVAELQEVKLANETERLRSALLSSVSHDLRSPLAAIIGAASSLRSYAESMSKADQGSLMETIISEGERLDRYIQNLLDMTRLGHAGLALEREWIGADELLGYAVQRLRRYNPEVIVDLNVPPGLPDLFVHPALVEQALFNVLENAAKFSPSGKAIRIGAYARDQCMHIDIADQGPGIPNEERERIFDMFYSVERGDRGHQGTGLGLAICRGMIGAHGGWVNALQGPDGIGTTISIGLPLLDPPCPSVEDERDE